MKNERLYAAFGAADDELLIRCEAGIKRQKFTWIKFGSLAACAAAVLIFCIWAIPGLISTQNNPIENTPNNPAMDSPYNPTENTPNNPAMNSPHNPTESIPFDPNNTAIVGLPALDFNLADLHNSSGIEAERMIRMRTTDFFSNGAPDTVVFVRVLDIEEWIYKGRDIGVYTSERQTSTVHVISTVWSGVEVPDVISIMQWKYGGCCVDEETNLLRVGGVYMLPLWYWEDDDVWIIDGDLDVLFEVDDQGRVWSHSIFEEFMSLDGMDWSVLADSITAITSDENFPAAITMFGRIANYWGRLTEVTIMSVTHSVSEYGYDQIEYGMRVDDVLSVAYTWSSWQPEVGDEITAISHGDAAYLELGKRYLILLDPSEGGPYIEAARVANINADGTITSIPLSDQDNWQKSVFLEFDGYTVAQMQEEAQSAKAWHERFAIMKNLRNFS